MVLNISFVDIVLSEIIYDQVSRLFPYSPRNSIDEGLVNKLKASILETGLLHPILVRAGTMEGIAGNHRFLALLEITKDDAKPIEEARIPIALVECDEGMAVTLA